MVYALELTSGAQAFAVVAAQFEMQAPRFGARGSVD